MKIDSDYNVGNNIVGDDNAYQIQQNDFRIVLMPNAKNVGLFIDQSA